MVVAVTRNSIGLLSASSSRARASILKVHRHSIGIWHIYIIYIIYIYTCINVHLCRHMYKGVEKMPIGIFRIEQSLFCSRVLLAKVCLSIGAIV